MSTEEYVHIAKSLVSEHFPDESKRILAGDTFEDSGLSSLDVVEMIVHLKKVYRVPLDGDELEVDSTISDLAELLEAKGVLR